MSNAMSRTKIFSNNMFGEIRTMIINGEPYFAGKDIALALGYRNVRDALSKHVDTEDKGVAKCDTLGGMQNLTIINESGLYSLILSSKLPSAKAFKRWVTSEVLPEIRKTGGYNKGEYVIDNNELMARALIEAQRIIADLQPKALYADVMQQSRLTISDFAEILKRNGVNTGSIRFRTFLRQNGYLVAAGERYNTPTDWAMDMGLFEVKEFSYGPTKSCLSKMVYITGKGQQYFIELFTSIKAGEDAEKTRYKRLIDCKRNAADPRRLN